MSAVWVLVWVLCAIGAGLFAHLKGRHVGWFALAGFALGPFGLAWAAFARRPGEPSRREQRAKLEADKAALAEARRRRVRSRDTTAIHWPD